MTMAKSSDLRGARLQETGMKLVVISGGTATNELVPLFSSLSDKISYILPVLDNGGSTSELIRVIGGPAIGDIRSRLTRLIPDEQRALRDLLTFRFSADPKEAKIQWNEIVDGSHVLWRDIDPARREIFRAFFIHVNTELLKRSKHQSAAYTTSKQFRYELANVGNLFLTGARLFIGSLDSAIELFARISGINPNTEVLPCINTNFSYHISALLHNGLIITGQSQISHPSENQTVDSYPPPINKTRPSSPSTADQTDYFQPHAQFTPGELNLPITNITTVNHRITTSEMISDFSDISDEEESGNTPQYIHPELKKSQLHFSKTEEIKPLLSPIERIFYISPYGQEIRPTAHHKVCTTISNADVLLYSIGSLMTSIVPIVVLRGVGKAIASDLEKGNKKRILLLNGCNDRETFGMEALDFVRIIVEHATYSFKRNVSSENLHSTNWSGFVSHLVHMKDLNIHVDVDALKQRGVDCVEVSRQSDGSDYFDLQDLESKLFALLHDD